MNETRTVVLTPTETPNYYGILPAHVRYADITPNAKILYSEISALTNKEGFCWASNGYFAKLYKVGDHTVSRWISELKHAGFLDVEIKNDFVRHIRLSTDNAQNKVGGTQKEVGYSKTSIGVLENDVGGTQKEVGGGTQNRVHNNTSINIKTNIKDNRFTPPTIEEVTSYTNERGTGIDPNRFFDFYQSKGWRVGAQPMKDWRAAVRTWERRDSGGFGNKNDSDVQLSRKGQDTLRIMHNVDLLLKKREEQKNA